MVGRGSPIRHSLFAIRQSDAEPPGEVLHVLPGDPSRARAARGRPFERLGMQPLAREWNAEVGDIAVDHRQELVLAAAVEAEPKPEAVRERDLLLDCLAGI